MANTVVVCENVPHIRELVSGLLEDAGYTVVAEVDVVPFLIAAVRAAQPRLVLLDLLLEGLSGLTAVPDLLAVAPDTRIVVFSAQDAWRDEAIAAGVHVWVDKPDFERLAAVVRELAE